jgi:hypothetical protein
MREDLRHLGDLLAERSGAAGALGASRVVLRHGQKNDCGRDRGCGCERVEHAAPIGEGERRFDRRSRGHRAEATRREHATVDQRKPVARVPAGDGGHSRHKARRHAEPDESAADREPDECIGGRKDDRADAGDEQERGLGPARPDAIEHDAERQLNGGEGQIVHAGQQPEARGIEREVAHQIGRDHRVDRAKHVREVIAERERQEDAQGDGERHDAS